MNVAANNAADPADLADSTVGRRMHPLLEARRYLLEPYADFAAIPPEAQAAWKAPYGEPEDWDLDVFSLAIDGPHGSIPVRVYQPAPVPAATKSGAALLTGLTGPASTPKPDDEPSEESNPGRPCLIWMHGGAFAFGDLDMPEAHEVARGVAGRANAVVISVDYHLTPIPPELGGKPGTRLDAAGNPIAYPIPFDDVAAVVAAVRNGARRIGVDPARIALGGASAGATLAAGVSLRLGRAGVPLWRLLMLYPVVHRDYSVNPDVAAAIAAAPAALQFPKWMRAAIERSLLGGNAANEIPNVLPDEAFPGLAPDLVVLPPTFIEHAEFDVFRASGEAFAQQLRAASVDVVEQMAQGVPHGHLDWVGFEPAHATLDAMAEFLTHVAADTGAYG